MYVGIIHVLYVGNVYTVRTTYNMICVLVMKQEEI